MHDYNIIVTTDANYCIFHAKINWPLNRPSTKLVFNMVHSAQTGKLENYFVVMINKQSRNHTLCTAMKSPGTHLQTSFPHTGMLAQPIRFVDCKFRFPIRLQCCYWIACHAIILQVFDMSSGATSWLIPLISLPNHTLYTPVEVGHIFCTRDYALEIIVCLHSYLNSSSVFELDGLFSDVSMQITVKVELKATITLLP